MALAFSETIFFFLLRDWVFLLSLVYCTVFSHFFSGTRLMDVYYHDLHWVSNVESEFAIGGSSDFR